MRRIYNIDGRDYEVYQLSNEQIVRLVEGDSIMGAEKTFLIEKAYERFKNECCPKGGETNDDVFARFFGNYVNHCPNDFKRAAKGMAKEHRYLQNEMFKVFMEYVKILAENCEKGFYDPRNYYAAQSAKKILDHFKEINWPY